MISTILIGNKQFSVRPGSRLRVEKLNTKKGELWLGTKVLAIQKESGEAVFGEPFIDKAQVKARVVRHGKAKKVLILKKNRRKGYRRTQGHRQMFTEIHIEALADSTGQWVVVQNPQKSVKPKTTEPTDPDPLPQKRTQSQKTATAKTTDQEKS